MLTRAQKDLLAAQKLMENITEQWAAEAEITPGSLADTLRERDEVLSKLGYKPPRPQPKPLTPAIPETPEERARLVALLAEIQKETK